MTVTLNKVGQRNAASLIEGGHYDADSAWSFDADDGDKLLGSEGKDWDNFAKWFLGTDSEGAEDTKDRYKYPFGKDGKVYRGALIAIRQRASQQDVTGIYDAAGALITALDAKNKSGDDDGRSANIGIARRSMDVSLTPDSLNEDDRTVDAVLSTGATVRRNDWKNGEYDEALDMDPGSIRMGRLNAGAPLLDSHDYYGGTQSMLGAVVPGTAKVDKGKLKAKFKFSRSANGDRAFQDVKDGVLRHVSVGYMTHKETVDDTKSPSVRTATDWEPYECSAVTMPADPGAGFRAGETQRINHRAQPANNGDRSMTTAVKDAPAADKPTELDANTRALVSAAVSEGVRAEQARRSGIEGVGRQLNLSDDFVRSHTEKATSLEDFRTVAIEEAARRANEAPTTSYNPHLGGPAVITDPKREPEKGEMAARMIRCYAGARRAGISPIEFSRTIFKDAAITRALSSGLEASGGALVPEQWATEIIELLRPQAVIRGANPVVMPMPGGNLTVPRINSGSNAHYVGENSDIQSGDLGTGDVKLSAKKLAAIVPISNDLIRFSSFQADQVVRDDIVAAIAVAEDVAFIRGAGTQFSPKGMRNWAQAANIIQATSGSPTEVGVITDTNKLLNALQGNNVRMIRPSWFMSFRTFNYLNSVVTTTGAFVWRDELNAGKFRGYPYKVTNNIPNNLSTGVGSESELYLADMADCVIGEVPGFMIDVSQDAVYTPDGTNLVSAFSRDQTVIRVIEQHDFALRHDFSVAVLTQVVWQ